MTSYRITHTIFAACVSALIVAAATANASIAQCANAAGEMTFTDVPCKTDAETVRIVRVSNAPLASMRVQPPINSFVAAERARLAKVAMQGPSERRLAGDVAMVKIARATALMDAPSILAREQALLDTEQTRASSYLAWLVPMFAFRTISQSAASYVCRRVAITTKLNGAMIHQRPGPMAN